MKDSTPLPLQGQTRLLTPGLDATVSSVGVLVAAATTEAAETVTTNVRRIAQLLGTVLTASRFVGYLMKFNIVTDGL